MGEFKDGSSNNSTGRYNTRIAD